MIRSTTAETNPLNGFEPFAMLEFTGVTPESAFVDLEASNLAAKHVGGTDAACVGLWKGRAALIASEPLIDAWLTETGEKMVSIFGKAGVTYELITAPDVNSRMDFWSLVSTHEMPTNLFISTPILGAATESPIFFLGVAEREILGPALPPPP